MLQRFQEDYATNSTVVNYAINNWIVPYKERFVSCWTNRVMHFDNATTCRAEGAHVKLKRFLGTSTCNLEGCWEKIHDMLETSFNAIKASFEKSINVVQHRYKTPIFQFLRDESERLLMLKIFRKIVTPSTTSMVEPDVQKKSHSFECGTLLSQTTVTTRPQKQKVIRPKASYHLGIGYIDQIPASFRGYVARTQDVNADGHCGFRAIAGLVIGD
ncbi:hypothetical protein C2S52_013750 [Perilla frutescens var. hirtella]|nr:hypothetical protein C2S52_013750 [Perilla frutescens var. hirtella]